MNNKLIDLDNLSRYDGKLKEHIDQVAEILEFEAIPDSDIEGLFNITPPDENSGEL